MRASRPDLPAKFRLLPAAVTPVLTAAAFFGFALIGLAASKGAHGVAALWPANAILLSALLLAPAGTRWRHVAWCLPVSICANLWSGTGVALACCFTLANLLTAVLAAHVMRRLRTGADAFESLSGVRRFLLAIVVSVPVGATIAAAGVAFVDGDFAGPWVSWAASDLLGMLLVSSVVLTGVRRLGANRDHQDPVSGVGLAWPLLIVVAATAAVFAQSNFPLLFVPLAALVLATYRLGSLGAVLGTAIVATIGLLFIMVDRGPISLITGSLQLRILFFQFYLATLFATCLPLAMLLAERARLADERADGERRHRRILERSREVIFETDLKGHWTYLNPAWEALTGRSSAADLGRSFLNLVRAEDRKPAIDRLASLYRQTVGQCQQELRFLHADGGSRWASVRSHLLTDARGAIIGTYGTIHDVTQAKTAEAARAEGERLYRLLADNSNDMIVRLNLQGLRHYVSPASVNVLGYEPHEMIGEAAAGAIHPDDRATVIETCGSLLEGSSNPVCMYRQLHKAGHYVWLEASYRLIRDPETGAPTEFIASVRDVGRREAAELERVDATARLQEAHRLLVMAEDMARVGHWRVDLASGSVHWSDVVCSIHGRPSGYAPALQTAIEAYHPDDRALVQEAVDRALRTGEPYEFKARLLRVDGAVRHVASRGRAEIGPDGSVVGLFGVLQDVTEAHAGEAAVRDVGRRLADSNRMLRMAESVARVGHWRLNTLAGEQFWSEEAYRIYGLSPSWRPRFENTLEMYHADDRDRVRATVEQAIAARSGFSFRARILRPTGVIAYVSVRGEIDLDETGEMRGMFGIIQDITEQAAAEALLSEREARFRLITEQASDMISLHDPDGRCRFMSPAARTILGYDPDDMLETSVYDLAPVEDHPALQRHREELLSARPGSVASLRYRLRKSDGELIWVEVSARLVDDTGQTKIIAVTRDVNAQVAAETALLAARREAEAAAHAKSSFLANMSHEIRTPMNGVIGFTELLLASELSPEQRRQAGLIADSGRAMMRLLNDILDISKIEAGQMRMSEEPFDLPHALRACMKLISPAAAQKGLELRCELPDDLPRMVVGDGLRLRQIVLNLLGNAAKFTSEGAITLRATASADTDASRVVIEVEDTGIGIAPERQSAIFDQFVQADAGTTARYGGTGLGLAISAQLAQLMGGGLGLDSTPGVGSRFLLTLPLEVASADVPLAPAVRAEAHGGAAPPPRGTRVLVAEDHDINQMLIVAMLNQLDCAVDLAANGAEAIDMTVTASACGKPYKIILMDMQMPEIDGLEAARRIRALGFSPDRLPIVALTANAFADDVAACHEAGMQDHLAKPVSLDALGGALRRWIPAIDISASGAARFSPAIQERYRTRKGEVLDRLDAMMRAGDLEGADLAGVADLLHKLAGTAEMFGDGRLGEEARLLEIGIEEWTGDDRAARIAHAVDAIRHAA